MRKLQTSRTYDYKKQYMSKSDLPSMTQPDQSLTIPEILKRYASGRPLNVRVYDEYDGDDPNVTGVDVRTLDIVQVNELLATTRANLDRLQLETNRRLQEKRDKELEESIIAKHEARKAEKAQPEDKPAIRFIQPSLPMPGITDQNGAK